MNSYNHRLLNTNPKAFSDEKEMLQRLKESPNWREGTIIKHDWDKGSNQVTFLYDFPNSDNKSDDDAWEFEICKMIKEYPTV